jgi:hypothetical protein
MTTARRSWWADSLFPLAVAALTFMFLGAVLFGRPPDVQANDASRWATVDSLLHGGTFDISRSHFGATVDQLKWTDDAGVERTLSSKPAIMAAWVAALAWPLDRMGLAITDMAAPRSRLAMALVLTVVNFLPFALCLAAYWWHLRQRGFDAWTARISFVAAACGTYWTGYMTTLTNHTVAAAATFGTAIAFLAWSDAESTSPSVSSRASTYAALFAGIAVAHESAAALLLAAVLLSVLARAPRQLGPAVLAALLPLIGWLAVERAATGAWLPRQIRVILFSKDAPNVQLPPYWQAGGDFTADDGWHRLLHMTFGHHGIFSLSPILLLGLVPLACGIRQFRTPAGHRYATVLAMSGAAFAVFWRYTANYGGSAQGFRWLFWLIPLWLLVLPHALQAYASRSRLARGAVIAALALSMWSALSCALQPWERSWLEVALSPDPSAPSRW